MFSFMPMIIPADLNVKYVIWIFFFHAVGSANNSYIKMIILCVDQ